MGTNFIKIRRLINANQLFLISFLFFLTSGTSLAKEYHVSVNGSNSYDGTASRPFKTINFAAQIAQPGDVIPGMDKPGERRRK
jgi:hypothetical protein